MSQFSETLTRLMRQKHLKSVELCEILSIRKSRFSKIKNGGILPTDFSLVEQLAKAMHLNPQEEKELYLSYQMSKFGHTYEQIEASMKRLYEVECPQYYQKEECLDTPVSAEKRTPVHQQNGSPCGGATALPEHRFRADRYTAGGSGPVGDLRTLCCFLRRYGVHAVAVLAGTF